MPTHTHPDPGHYHQHYAPYLSTASAAPGVPIPTSYVGLANTWLAYTGILASGGDDAHNNMQPSLVLSYWIVAK